MSRQPFSPLTDPSDPIAAVTHAYPYPYYARLVDERPFYFDSRLACWVAASAQAVRAVLENGSCRVRPPAEPVPTALLDSDAGHIFRHLIRMHDRTGRRQLKRGVSAALDSLDEPRASRVANSCAQALLESGAGVANFCSQLPAHVIASLLGAADEELTRIGALVADFVRCLSPAATADQLNRGKTAATLLLQWIRRLLGNATSSGSGLAAVLAGEMQRAGCDDVGVVLANGIGLLSQASEATAGLIGNTFLTLARRSDVRALLRNEAGIMRDVVNEVLRIDSPVHNTRRFVAAPEQIMGKPLEAGDAILVLLAAANQDTSANAAPHQFDAQRTNRQTFSFGVGAHACPGGALAQIIATEAVEGALRFGMNLEQVSGSVSYRASTNLRVPDFGEMRFR